MSTPLRDPEPGGEPPAAPVPAPAGPPPTAAGRLAALRAHVAPRWLNAPPLLVATAAEGAPPELLFIEPALADRVILLVFWDMTCALSLRTVPFLAAWHQRYARFGLTIIGVHAPEFSFGRERAHVEREVARLGITYPVLLDNDFAVSRALDNQVWPRTILLDRGGQVVLDHAGPGGYAQIGTHIVAALAVESAGVSPLKPLPAPAAPLARVQTLPATPDLYCGLLRTESKTRGTSVAGEAAVDHPEESRRVSDRLYRSGRWRSTRESWIALPTPGKPAVLRVRATTAEISAVLRGDPGGTEIRVLLDGRPVRRERTGADVARTDETGGERESVCRAAEPRLYRLIRGPVHATVEFALVVTAGELEVFALRFQGGLTPSRGAAAPGAGPVAV